MTLDPSDRVPDTYIQLDFNQGPSTAGAGVRSSVYVMAMLASGGTWQPNQLVQVTKENDAIVGAGSGSPIHRALRMHLKANNSNKVYALPYLPSSGGAVAADGYGAISGTATASGSLSVTVAGEQFTISINSGDTAATVISNAVAQINSRTWLPVTASSSSGKLVLTAKIAGASQGDGTVGVIRYRMSVTSGIGITVTTPGAALGLGAGAHAGSDGSTTELANFQTALNVINNVRRYYIGTNLWTSSQLGALKTHLATKGAVTPGLRSVGISAFTGPLSSAQTLAVGLNYERLQIGWQPNSEHDVAEIVGNLLAVRQKFEGVDPVFNFDNNSDVAPFWLLQPVYSTSDVLDHADMADAIEDGLSPIQSTDTGSFLVTSSTTRTKDATGTVDDFRSAETHRVSGADFICDTIQAKVKATFNGFRMKPDILNSDGSVDTTQKLGPKVTTPSRVASAIRAALVQFGPAPAGTDILQDLANSQASVVANIDSQNNGRMDVNLDIAVIDLAHQFVMSVSETSSG